MDAESLEAILAESAEAAGFAAVFTVEDGSSWVAMAPDETAFAIEWRAAARRLVLSADIAVLADAGDAATLALLLRYNANWRETDGLRIALDSGDVATLALDLPADAIDAPWLSTVLAGFADALNGWREALSAPRSRDAHPQEEATPVNAAMRV